MKTIAEMEGQSVGCNKRGGPAECWILQGVGGSRRKASEKNTLEWEGWNMGHKRQKGVITIVLRTRHMENQEGPEQRGEGYLQGSHEHGKILREGQALLEGPLQASQVCLTAMRELDL